MDTKESPRLAAPSDGIEHVVYLMLENRSLDNVLGWIYENAPPKHNIPAPATGNPTYNTGFSKDLYNLDKHGKPHNVCRGTSSTSVPSLDPYEEFDHVTTQLFGPNAVLTNKPLPNMSGFYQDYASYLLDPKKEIMETYTPDQLPVLSSLATGFAVSDSYFASVPTQTNANRAFSATGNSLGMDKKADKLTAWVNNNMTLFWLPTTFNQRTIWRVCTENSVDWKVYFSDVWPDLEGWCFTRDMFDEMLRENDNNFQKLDNFFTDLTTGNLPKFSYLEPAWGLSLLPGLGINGNDYHPPNCVCEGEEFVHKVVSALQSSPCWNKTLLIINFDEHGGTYDHVPPPWGAPRPWDNKDDGTSAPQACEKGFEFDRYGVRVPLILVSPLIEEQTVFRVEPGQAYDHCSTIATILKLLKVDSKTWRLGTRVAKAATYENVITRTIPREARPLPVAYSRPANAISDPAANDLQHEIALRALFAAGRKHKKSEEEVKRVYDKHFSGGQLVALNETKEEKRPTRTVSQLRTTAHNAFAEITGKSGPAEGQSTGGSSQLPPKSPEAPKSPEEDAKKPSPEQGPSSPKPQRGMCLLL